MLLNIKSLTCFYTHTNTWQFLMVAWQKCLAHHALTFLLICHSFYLFLFKHVVRNNTVLYIEMYYISTVGERKRHRLPILSEWWHCWFRSCSSQCFLFSGSGDVIFYPAALGYRYWHWLDGSGPLLDGLPVTVTVEQTQSDLCDEILRPHPFL